MFLKPLKKVLVLKVPRTHSCTEMSCSETTANLESDEIVEPETEAISKETSEAPSLGNNKLTSRLRNYKTRLFIIGKKLFNFFILQEVLHWNYGLANQE